MDLKRTLGEMLGLDDDDLLDRIFRKTTVRHFKKGNVIYEYGAIPREVGFLLSGVVAAIEPDEHGGLVIDCITETPGTPMLPVSGLGAPACHTARILSSSQVLLWPTDFAAELLEPEPAMQHSFFNILMRCAQDSREEKQILHCNSARERYMWFLKKHPNFPPRGLNKYVAAYLNISPETISRIRRELDKEASASSSAPVPDIPAH